MISGGILAAGGSRRFGDRDKALIELAGRPLIAHVAERLRPHVHELLINAPENTNPLISTLGNRIVPDTPGFAGRGPLAGMHALLSAMKSDWLLCLPCDAPRFPDAVLQGLLDQAEVCENAAVVRVNGRTNPVCCLLHRRCAGPIAEALRQGRPRSTDIIHSLSPSFIDHDDNRPGLWSLNTPDELAACARDYAAPG